MLETQFHAKSDTGMVRKKNEDSVLVDAGIGLAAVADGMGGHSFGEVASSTAVAVLSDTVRKLVSGELRLSEGEPTGRSERANYLLYAFNLANAAVFKDSSQLQDKRGMGTTLTAILVNDRSAALAHIGDSRAYLMRKGKLIQLTQDHSLVMEQVRSGLITKEEAETSSMQNVLVRAMGVRETAAIDIADLALEPGDRLLLCSDGLFKALKETALADALTREPFSPQFACEELVDRANAAGGPDNVSVIIAQVGLPGLSDKTRAFSSRLRELLAPAAGALRGFIENFRKKHN